MSEERDLVEAHYSSLDLGSESLDHPEWFNAPAVSISHYWSAAEAPEGRHAEARLIWTDEALYVRFVCNQTEPLVVNSNPQLDKKTMGLWERDVCEIFIAPDANRLNRYFEFEAAPTGEWIDLVIDVLPEKRETEWEFNSGMIAQAHVEEDQITIGMRVPWTDRFARPHRGDRWRANLFRCVGSGESRGYLSWQPTRTPQPLFHVPEAFGTLIFA